MVRNEITRLDGIVREFLSSARPPEPKLVSTSARSIFNEVARLVTPQLAEQSIELMVDASDEQTFRADLGQLKQVLHNLIRNASESITGEGFITLRARFDSNAVLRGQATPVVILEVEDTGAGIPADVQSRLFDPFFSTKENGTGLGLSISARIIDRHGGALGFETRMGEGTIFRVSLPAAHA